MIETNHAQLLTLAVTSDKRGLVTTGVQVTFPAGIDVTTSSAPAGWKTTLTKRGSGAAATIAKATFFGGKAAQGQLVQFQFIAKPTHNSVLRFAVHQTYSKGTVVDWNGAAGSATPAPSVIASSTIGGNELWPIGSIIAIVLAIVALLVAGVATAARKDSGRARG